MSLFCRGLSSVAALPFRSVRSAASLQTGVQRVTVGGRHQFRHASLVSFSKGSTLRAITADENLVSLLEHEIENAIVNEAPLEDELPEGFPFRIADITGERAVHLMREFEGDETIFVLIDPSAPLGDEEEKEDPQAEQVPVGIRMVISMTKHDDDGPCLEFIVNAYVHEIVIEAVYVEQPHEPTYPYQGPDFADLDENLQKAFHRFLEIRGIKPTLTEFLADYMANKESRERRQWLKDVKSFVVDM